MRARRTCFGDFTGGRATCGLCQRWTSFKASGRESLHILHHLKAPHRSLEALKLLSTGIPCLPRGTSACPCAKGLNRRTNTSASTHSRSSCPVPPAAAAPISKLHRLRPFLAPSETLPRWLSPRSRPHIEATQHVTKRGPNVRQRLSRVPLIPLSEPRTSLNFSGSGRFWRSSRRRSQTSRRSFDRQRFPPPADSRSLCTAHGSAC